MPNNVLCLRPKDDFLRVGVTPPQTLSISYDRPDNPELANLIKAADALVIPAVGPALPAELFQGSKVRMVQVTGAGVDRLDEAGMKALRIPVANVAGGSNAALAEYAVATRFVVDDGAVLALQELQRVATRHGASKNRLRHLLRLADFYEVLSREYLAAVPPESLGFDPAKFRELAEATTQLYELVASHDGSPEKLEAARSLEAFLALTLSVDADRFDR